MFNWITVCIFPVVLTIIYYFPIVWSLLYLLFLTIFLVIAVFVFTIWGHVSLSSPYQTPLFLLDKLEKDVRHIKEILKVSKILILIV